MQVRVRQHASAQLACGKSRRVQLFAAEGVTSTTTHASRYCGFTTPAGADELPLAVNLTGRHKISFRLEKVCYTAVKTNELHSKGNVSERFHGPTRNPRV